ncbi:dipeptide ABC transporter ATP-binding protein [Rhodococcoides kyotonense]|uniref:Peptide/nickel transport system ATP-binding protein n=1 Tax=Rhodococcoides kyotonense TaxID=398843 RepID=A0A239H754_9NOCA|nr:ABC transporter ATP-binding protein [Rhodococcus kyotonensis]SNS77001.1 peptide/nickel transport system ATP-binding protein [Rhodococcus kyotonensis]
MTAVSEITRAPGSDEATPLLSVRDLSVSYSGDLASPTVSDVSFDVHAGTTVAIVGESGSGKSTVVNAVLNLLDDRVAVGGSAHFGGRDVLRVREREFRRIRGRRIGFVPQDPTASLDPVRRIDRQIFEAFRTSRLPEYSKSGDHHAQAVELLDAVGIVDPERALHSYPHQLSGGQLQRVLIGIAISQRPDLIIADEPTSALDVTIQKTILDLIDRLKAEHGLSVLLITHDLSLAAERSDTVVVLNGGRVEESGVSVEVLRDPHSEYARALIADIPSIEPDRFAEAKSRRPQSAASPALVVADVHKTFSNGRHRTEALKGVSFEIPEGRTHALVGESGSGKSTLARIVLRLEEPDTGHVLVAGQDISHLGQREIRAARRNLQLVYQNPFHSLDPTYSVGRLVSEPLVRYKVGTRAERRQRVIRVLDLVGLDQSYLSRGIAELSGGQRQRVAIARALSLSPKVLVLDEPTSALDVTVQAQILEVLVDLQVKLGVSYLFISHDLSVVRQLADTVTVLRHGVVQEQGETATVFTDPQTDYTARLVESIPNPAVHRTFHSSLSEKDSA